jgi:hypothetical protein
MPHVPAVAPPSAEGAVPSRLCGRCRGSFAGDPTSEANLAPDWWLCDACRQVLLPGRSAREQKVPSTVAPR